MPNELYVILLGRYTKIGVYRVLDVYIPENCKKFGSPHHVTVQPRWWDEAKEIASAQKMRLLGDLHTHPPLDDFECKEPAPSTTDLEGYDFLYYQTRLDAPITGVCAMYQSKRGVEMNIQFYIAANHPVLKITA